MDEDDSSVPPQSRTLFVVEDPHLSILQLEAAPNEVVRFNLAKELLLPPIPWSLSPPITSSSSSTGGEDLYLFPDWCGADAEAVKRFHGYKFNLRTGSFRNICLPPTIKEGKPDCAINHGGRIYRMYLAESVFGCYDPINNSWKALKPFPYDNRFMPRVNATAALDDTILFNMHGWGFQVYDIRGNEWYFVEADDFRCYSIVGEAVVLENTIYAVTHLFSDVLLALSIEKEASDGDVVFKCCLRSEILMPSMTSIASRDANPQIFFPRVRTKHLVHLGGVDFCLVRSCGPLSSDNLKRIHVTYMRLTGGEVIVKSDHLFKTRYEKQSEVVLCFSLPKWNTTALEQGKEFLFDLNTFTAEDQCSIRVRELPPNVIVTQDVEGFIKYGPIKRHGVEVKNKKGKSFDFVEFPRFTSKKHPNMVPQSLFAVVFYIDEPRLGILQLDTLGQWVPVRVNNTNVDGLKEHVVCFNEANGRWSVFPGISSTGDLYLFPDWCDVKPIHGYKFNFSTGSLQSICLPPSFKQGKPDSAVNLGGRIYRMYLVESVFGCYDPINNSWKALKPFPYDNRFMPRVNATAALDDTILFNMHGWGFQVYDVGGNEWYFVEADDFRCYSIVGEAVVVGNTIYAITHLVPDVLLAFSIEKEVSGGDVVFKCSVRSEIFMPSMTSIVSLDADRPIFFPRVRTKHLVHLGGGNFCLVRSCDPLSSNDPKRIHVTYMKHRGGKVIVKSEHLVKTRYEKQSEVVLCFSLPKWNTTALEEAKQFVFELDRR